MPNVVPSGIPLPRSARTFSWLVRVQPGQHSCHGCRAHEAKRRAPPQIPKRQSRLPSVDGGPLVCLQPGVHLPAHVPNLPKRGVSDVQRRIVASGVEHGQRLLDEGGQLFGRALRLEEGA